MLRNKEIRQFLVIFCLIAACLLAASFRIGPAAGITAACGILAFGCLFFVFTWLRYRRIAGISEQIDLVLHNGDRLYIAKEEEGELSILQSEVMKMTLRIREQNEALRREKEFLADSLADIAHQLRTPLTSLTLVLTLLEKEPEKGEREGMFREAEELLVRMDWLLTSLLKLSRLDAGVVAFRNEQISAGSLVKKALKPLSIPLELHEITVCVDVPEGIFLAGDEGWLSEAVQNILKNCMESAGDGGKIEIFCEETPLFTELRIRDNGAGFRKEELPRLFERFYRGTDSGTSGYGIGLALCKTIIVKQGGTITAGNHPDGGAVFTIRFSKTGG